MEIFKNSFLFKLILIISVILIISMFAINSKVYADPSDDEDSETWGGILMKPVIGLLTGISDGIMEILEKNVNGKEISFIEINGNNDWWATWGAKALGFIIGAVVATAVIAAIGATAGIGAGGLAALIAKVGIGHSIAITAAAVLGLGATGILVADFLDGASFSEDIKLPYFSVSLDNIFSDNIALLDVNFFDEDKVYKTTETETNLGEEATITVSKEEHPFYGEEVKEGIEKFYKDTHPSMKDEPTTNDEYEIVRSKQNI